MLLSLINASDLHTAGVLRLSAGIAASRGIEAVGIVETLGPGVHAPAVGTRVVFVGTWQTWREQIVCLAPDKLVPVPDGLDDLTAATSYVNPLTAWALTRSAHNLKTGDWLLQTAAGSTSVAELCFNWRSSIDSRQSTSSGGASRKPSSATSVATR